MPLCQSARLWGMSWSGDEIVYGEGSLGIMRVSAEGGMPEQIANVESTELAASPQMLPGNRAVLFTTLAVETAGGIEQWDTARIVVQAMGSGERKTIVERGSHARYLSSGHIVYVVDGVLFAAPFDERRLQNRSRCAGGERRKARRIREHGREVQRVRQRFARVRPWPGFDVGCSAA